MSYKLERLGKLAQGLFLGGLIFLLGGRLLGAAASPAAALAPAGPNDPAEIEAFVDGFWRERMQPLGIPGAVFVLVKGDTRLVAKGYGLVNVEKGEAVDPQKSLFAVGSVSKAVTASAVLQLVERGQLDLQAPVNSYLKSFQLDESCSAGLSTTDLLTHSAGFDERVIGAFVLSAADLRPLGEYVAHDLPPCIRPAEQEMSYCNHCYGLAGLLVQEVSGQPFETYVEENIFQPLGMAQSSFRQPMPVGLDKQRATGYIFTPERQPAPLVYANFYPSGGLWTTGADMGQFIIGQLRGGLPGGAAVFSPETRALMQQGQFSQDPRLEGWTYGFFEHFENGQRLIGKDGDYPGFSSALYLLPEHELGFFLSYNATVSSGAGVIDPRLVFPSAFLAHYYPDRPAWLPVKTSNQAANLAGYYRLARYSHTTIDKAISPMAILQWRIEANPDGSLSLAYPALLGGQTSQWVEVGPRLFQSPATGSFLSYAEDADGRVNRVYTKITEEGVLERVGWYETLAFQGGLLGLVVVVFVATLVVLAFRWLGRQRQKTPDTAPVRLPPGLVGRLLKLVPAMAGALSGLNLLFLAGLALTISQSMTTRAPTIPGYFMVLLALPLAALVLTVLLAATSGLAWGCRAGSTAGRIGLSLISLAGLAFTWFASYWNLLGYKL